MIEGSIFIGAVIIAITQAIKLTFPRIHGAVTIAAAVLVGIAVALVDQEIGVVDITVAQGLMVALAAVGVHQTARQVG